MGSIVDWPLMSVGAGGSTFGWGLAMVVFAAAAGVLAVLAVVGISLRGSGVGRDEPATSPAEGTRGQEIGLTPAEPSVAAGDAQRGVRRTDQPETG